MRSLEGLGNSLRCLGGSGEVSEEGLGGKTKSAASKGALNIIYIYIYTHIYIYI